MAQAITTMGDQFFNDKLNASQRQAIDFAINDSNITIIHGPPGTGKTYTLIELIQQLTSKGEKFWFVVRQTFLSIPF